jgi:hypothetical protein
MSGDAGQLDQAILVIHAVSGDLAPITQTQLTVFNVQCTLFLKHAAHDG